MEKTYRRCNLVKDMAPIYTVEKPSNNLNLAITTTIKCDGIRALELVRKIVNTF